MWQRSPIRIREVLLGVIIGFGIAGLFFVWKDEGVHKKQMSTIKYNAGE